MHPLYQALLAGARFHELLLTFDRDLADTARCAGCALCNGVLHSARYRRKPRGRLCQLGEEHDWRFSFCCAVDGCRTRPAPPSLRFPGRKVERILDHVPENARFSAENGPVNWRI